MAYSSGIGRILRISYKPCACMLHMYVGVSMTRQLSIAMCSNMQLKRLKKRPRLPSDLHEMFLFLDD